MERLVCSYCGIPFRARRPAGEAPVYCCSGCGLASRMRISGDEFPVTPQLLFGLGLGFAAFNQVLLLLLAVALAREGRGDAAAISAGASAVIGIAIVAAAFAWQWFSRWLRATDAIVFALSGVIAAADALLLVRGERMPAAITGLVATGIVALWQVRGMVRKWIAGK